MRPFYSFGGWALPLCGVVPTCLGRVEALSSSSWPRLSTGLALYQRPLLHSHVYEHVCFKALLKCPATHVIHSLPHASSIECKKPSMRSRALNWLRRLGYPWLSWNCDRAIGELPQVHYERGMERHCLQPGFQANHSMTLVLSKLMEWQRKLINDCQCIN